MGEETLLIRLRPYASVTIDLARFYRVLKVIF